MIQQRVVSRVVKRDEKCPACGVVGMGDRAGVSRYARVSLPGDLPGLPAEHACRARMET